MNSMFQMVNQETGKYSLTTSMFGFGKEQQERFPKVLTERAGRDTANIWSDEKSATEYSQASFNFSVTQVMPKVCDACKTKNEDDNEIVENLCKNDFALKIKVKEIAYINGDTKITPETKSKTIYKLNGVTERDLKKTVLWLRGGLQCTCDEMNDINAPYLVMGQRLAGELVITSVKRWQKGQRAFKRFSRSIRKLQC
ncbi:hypothetical protein L345_01137, partial [Ophiophagus hannah]